MAGKGVSMLVSPTENIGKILAAFDGIHSSGETQFSTAVQIAQLALKHRKNKNGGQRIIIFVGSPIKEDVKALQKLGVLIKKNGIAVDVIVMGEHEEIQEKLSEFVKSANSGENSHLIVVPPGVAPSDALITSPIFQGDDSGMAQAMAASTAGAGGDQGLFAEYGGVNPDLDPELAMALRLSAEEARAHEESQSRVAAEESKTQSNVETQGLSQFEDDEDAILQAALAMSLGGPVEVSSPTTESRTETSTTQIQQPQQQENNTEVTNENDGLEDEDDEDALQMALQLSMGGALSENNNNNNNDNNNNNSGAATAALQLPAELLNSDFVNELLGSVGVDQNDPLVLAALEQLAQSQASKDDKRPNPNEGDNENDNKKKRDG
eukprot:CAMPEP_0174821328 /NCGR_PEP_ID=MMETSP1107-20130205/6751_1 /TAXON_ID=36770 /ORGANISM="Paraphysomonas vestita, Strain GFlagA" /LENGTH=379 /DNA_ID=CAMNT_0016038229 /DNA_START=176 /DNA_END=1315 /DNA_ORIENTATION=+